MNKKIIDKIVKLMALSDNNPNEAEALSAKNMAGKLMAEHDIDIQMLSDAEKPEFETEEVTLKRKSLRKFDVMLYNHISRFNEVGYVIQDGNKYCPAKYFFIGSKSAIEANQYMVDIIIKQRNAKWKEHAKNYYVTIKPKAKQKHDWMKGFAMGIGVKISEMNKARSEVVKKWEGEKGLVVVSRRKQALAFFEEQNGKLGKSRKGKGVSIDYHGYQAGKETNFYKGIKASDSEKVTA